MPVGEVWGLAFYDGLAAGPVSAHACASLQDDVWCVLDEDEAQRLISSNCYFWRGSGNFGLCSEADLPCCLQWLYCVKGTFRLASALLLLAVLRLCCSECRLHRYSVDDEEPRPILTRYIQTPKSAWILPVRPRLLTCTFKRVLRSVSQLPLSAKAMDFVS